jgi:hypothetical protein
MKLHPSYSNADTNVEVLADTTCELALYGNSSDMQDAIRNTSNFSLTRVKQINVSSFLKSMNIIQQ